MHFPSVPLGRCIFTSVEYDDCGSVPENLNLRSDKHLHIVRFFLLQQKETFLHRLCGQGTG